MGWVVNRGRDESATVYTADQFQEFLRQPGAIRSLVQDGDRTFRTLARNQGFKPFDITRAVGLPDLRIVTVAERTDQEQFELARVLLLIYTYDVFQLSGEG